MQYFENINTIFIHIPKTCGSFIENNLKQISNCNKTIGGHTNYMTFKKNIENINQCNIFTIVRDPYERTISAFEYLI